MSMGWGINFYFKEKPSMQLIKKFVDTLVDAGYEFTVARARSNNESTKDLATTFKMIKDNMDAIKFYFNPNNKKLKEKGFDFTGLTLFLRIAFDKGLYDIDLYADDFAHRVLYEYKAKVMNRAFIINLIKTLYRETHPIYVYMDYEELYGLAGIAQYVNSIIGKVNIPEKVVTRDIKTPLVAIFRKEIFGKISKEYYEDAEIQKLEDGSVLVISKSLLENEN